MPLYLTRIRVSVLEAAQRRLTDPYAWHRAIWSAFPTGDGAPRDFLHRVDRRGGHFEVLVLSPKPPQVQPWGTWQTKVIPEKFFNYQRYAFSLRANPTQMRVVRTTDGKRRKNGRRTGIYQPAELRRWITRKLQEAGCQLEQFAFDPPLREHFYRKGRRGTHLRVDFRGILRVIDHQLFMQAVRTGIGRARAFGFGMLLLQPLPMPAPVAPVEEPVLAAQAR
ncbi:MAG: type I-E CRISPR-associated protein Cas6/Cse3/CasE [Thermoguttaceae bacterium]|nr:type I-E CRISPR-associated protein Cas6/Cse3/CasE [Thermoguttaceae bacterium]MDW8079855.1 type I-E CRISPR-associated protein Cas6/Cse3/CasE [Thermoguttaceae bacterium]